MMRGRRDLFGPGWDWAWEWESEGPGHRGRFHFLIRRRWWILAVLMALVALAALALSLGGGSAHEEPARVCDSAEVSVEGTLTGNVSWCGPRSAHVTDVIGFISVHYPANDNPCGFVLERGPGDSWFEVPGLYEIVLSTGPDAPGVTGSAGWRYDFGGSFSLCGGENSMRVTIVFITDLKGAPAWVEDFGTGAYGSRAGSFKPQSLPEPTPSPTASATATPTPSATLTTSATPTSSAMPITPEATPAGTPASLATPAAPAGGTATSSTSPPALAAPASSPPAAISATSTVTPAPSASATPMVKARARARASPLPAASKTPVALAASATPRTGALPTGGGGPGLGVIAAIALFGTGAAMMALGLAIHSWARKYN